MPIYMLFLHYLFSFYTLFNILFIHYLYYIVKNINIYKPKKYKFINGGDGEMEERRKIFLKGSMVKCETCGKEFYVAPSVLKFRTPKYCSRACIKKPLYILPNGKVKEQKSDQPQAL